MNGEDIIRTDVGVMVLFNCFNGCTGGPYIPLYRGGRGGKRGERLCKGNVSKPKEINGARCQKILVAAFLVAAAVISISRGAMLG